MKWLETTPGFFVGDLLPDEAISARKKLAQYIKGEARRMANLTDRSPRVDIRAIAALSEGEQLAAWREARETWMARFGYGGVDDLYLERRLQIDLPGFVFCPRKELGGKWKGPLPKGFTSELTKLRGELRFHRPTDRDPSSPPSGLSPSPRLDSPAGS